MTAAPLSRPAASAAVENSGWRLLLGNYAASVPVDGISQALTLAVAAAAACADDADGHLRIDLRADRVELALRPRAATMVTARDAEMAAAITDAVHGLGLELRPPAGPTRPVQMLEICIDALDIAAVRPFWRAVLGYEDEPGAGPEDAIVDPAGQLPSVWFQQMDAPRPERNRIHFDLDVAHDEAQRRVRAALEAGGVLVSDARARAFWVLADAEGNEICICTWQDRDGPDVE
jgi:4a-hydroxytetrahydrobiopterin dehydratase